MAKEWKGNSDSVRSRLAINKAHTTKGRETDDFYATDPAALEALLDHCSYYLHNLFCANPIIWECACGNGNLAKLLTKNGFVVYASDLKDRGFGNVHIDFLNTKIDNCPPIILTNPPYSLATEFIEHALEILPENGLYIALMNITYLAGQKRYERVYRYGSLREVYIFSKRIGCWKNGQRDDKKAHIINYAWYVFQKGYKGQPTLYWL